MLLCLVVENHWNFRLSILIDHEVVLDDVILPDLNDFLEEYSDLLKETEKELFRKDLSLYQRGGSDFNSILQLICKNMQKSSKYVIMIDEVSLHIACRKTTQNNKETHGAT